MKYVSKVRRSVIALVLLVMACTSVLTVTPATPALAAGELAARITRVTPIPVLSGVAIGYTVAAECTATSDAGCFGMVATIALPDEVVGASTSPNGLISNATFVRGTGLQIEFVDFVPGGTTMEFTVIVWTENDTTPDGFSFAVPMTLSANGVAPVQAVPSDGSVSAAINLVVDKRIDAPADQQAVVPLDDDVTYTIKVCDIRGENGRLGFESGALVDQLPEGSEYVSSSPAGAYDPVEHTVTWTLTPPRFEQCDFTQPNFEVTVRYPSAVFGDDADAQSNPSIITSVTNSAVATVRPIGRTDDVSANDDVPHQFVHVDRPAGLFSKSVADQTVFDGDYSGEFEVVYELRALGGTSDHITEIHDRFPCSTPYQGAPVLRSVHVSPVDGEPVCAAPTFVFETLTFDIAMQPLGPQIASAIADGWRPRYVDINGNSQALDLVGADTFVAPPGVTVSEIVLPADPRVIFGAGLPSVQPPFARINGHMIDDQPGDQFLDAPEGALVRNRADFANFTPAGQPLDEASDFADVRVLKRVVRTQVTKAIDDDGNVTITATNTGFGPIEDIVLTDLLPGAVTAGALTSVVLDNVSRPDAVGYEAISNYVGTRQLVRITLAPGIQLPPSDGQGVGQLRVTFATTGLALNQRPPGETFNFAQLFIADNGGTDLDACGTATRETQFATSDVNDLDADGDTADRYCEAAAVATGPSVDVQLSATKLTRGDLDAGFQGFPSVGSIDDGPGQFRLEVTNRGAVALDQVVLYDVLPAINDTAVRTTAGRESLFATPLLGRPTVISPSGAAVIEYSTATVPCRGEAFEAGTRREDWPVNCDDTWTDWDVTPPPTLSAITAIRISNLGPLPARSTSPDVTVTLDVGVPAQTVPGAVAWNSFAVAAVRTDSNTWLLPTEPPKVGLASPLTDVELDKLVNGQRSVNANIGDTVTYQITARHGTTLTIAADGTISYDNPAGSAPSTAQGVVVTDAVPAGMTLVPGSASNCAGRAPSGSFDEVAAGWTVGDIRPGDTFRLCFDAIVDGTVQTAIRNVAEVSAVAGPSDIDSTPGDMPASGPRPTMDDEDDAEVIPTQAEITIDKTVVANPAQPVLVSGSTYTADYLISVENEGDGPGSYSLVDTPDFALGATVERVQVVDEPGDAPAVAIDTTTGLDTIEIVADAPIAAGETHVYRVTTTFTIDPSMPGDVRQCGAAPTAGEGGFNEATIEWNDTTDSADACVDLPAADITMQKQPGSLVRNPSGSFAATYTITVSNSGDGPGQYDLEDSPVFPNKLFVVSFEISTDGGANWAPVAGRPYEIAAGSVIAPGATHSYLVRVTFTMANDTPMGVRQCVGNVPNQGAFNRATATVDGEQTTDEACIDLPQPDIVIAKSPGAVTRVGTSGSTYQATYAITVENVGVGPGIYTLSDTPDFGVGATVTRLQASSPTLLINVDVANPTGAVTLNSGESLRAGSSRTYFVTVTFTVAPTMAAGERQCGNAGDGAFNRATVTVGNLDRSDDACLAIPGQDLTIVKDNARIRVFPNFAFEASYRVTITNRGSGPGVYSAVDRPAFGPGSTITRVRVVNDPATGAPATDTSVDAAPFDEVPIVTDAAIDAGATHAYVVVVQFTIAPAMSAGDRDCDGNPGSGAFNSASLRFGQIDGDDSDACAVIPNGSINISKQVESVDPVDNDTVRVEYRIRVVNNGAASTQYDLDDTLDFGSGITAAGIEASAVTPGDLPIDASFTGAAPNTRIASGVTIDTGVVHEYRVVVTADVVTLDTSDTACVAGTPGHGLFNGAHVSSPDGDADASACADLAILTLVKRVLIDGGGNAVPSDFLLSATGPDMQFAGHGAVVSVVTPGEYRLAETGLPGWVSPKIGPAKAGSSRATGSSFPPAGSWAARSGTSICRSTSSSPSPTVASPPSPAAPRSTTRSPSATWASAASTSASR